MCNMYITCIRYMYVCMYVVCIYGISICMSVMCVYHSLQALDQLLPHRLIKHV